MDEAHVDVDAVLRQLLSVRTQTPGTEVHLRESDIVKLVLKSRSIFLSQPALIEVDAPINICGDTHGQYFDLLRLFEIGGFPPAANYLFLGDYVDRAKQSIETICLLLCYKLKYPTSFFLLRGNHECASINRIYGFYDECKRRYNVKLWKTFSDCFNCMPVAAIVAEKVLCMHGGLSPQLHRLDQIINIQRPTDVPDEGLLCDLLWADPEPLSLGWGPNARGVSHTFGLDIITDFLNRHDLDLICRAHQVVEDGYEFMAQRRLVTLFSAPNYCGEFDNAGAMLCLSPALVASFKVLRPTSHRKKMNLSQLPAASADAAGPTGPPGSTPRAHGRSAPISAMPPSGLTSAMIAVGASGSSGGEGPPHSTGSPCARDVSPGTLEPSTREV